MSNDESPVPEESIKYGFGLSDVPFTRFDPMKRKFPFEIIVVRIVLILRRTTSLKH